MAAQVSVQSSISIEKANPTPDAQRQYAQYDFSRFSNEDRQLYQDILSDLPFDGQLQKAFEEFNCQQRRQRRWDERHLDGRELCEYLLQKAVVKPLPLEEQVALSLDTKALNSAMGKLPHRSRKRLHMHYTLGLTQDRIAQIEGISQPAVAQSMQVALKQLKIYLADAL